MVAEFASDLIRLRTQEGMCVAKAKGRLRGRQPKLNARQEAHLVALHHAGEHSTAEPGELFGVGRSTDRVPSDRARPPTPRAGEQDDDSIAQGRVSISTGGSPKDARGALSIHLGRVGHAQPLGCGVQPPVARPQGGVSSEHGGGEQLRVDVADPEAEELLLLDVVRRTSVCCRDRGLREVIEQSEDYDTVLEAAQREFSGDPWMAPGQRRRSSRAGQVRDRCRGGDRSKPRCRRGSTVG